MNTPSTSQEWKPIIAEWRTGGLSVAEFCRQKNLSPWTFHYWRRKLEAKPGRRPRRAGPSSPTSALRFVTAHVVPTGPTPIEVALAGGRSLRVAGDFDEAVLRKLVAALEALR
jgi:transposase-like protein